MRDSVFGVELDCNQCTVQRTNTYQTVLNKLTMDVIRTRFLGLTRAQRMLKLAIWKLYFPHFSARWFVIV